MGFLQNLSRCCDEFEISRVFLYEVLPERNQTTNSITAYEAHRLLIKLCKNRCTPLFVSEGEGGRPGATYALLHGLVRDGYATVDEVNKSLRGLPLYFKGQIKPPKGKKERVSSWSLGALITEPNLAFG